MHVAIKHRRGGKVQAHTHTILMTWNLHVLGNKTISMYVFVENRLKTHYNIHTSLFFWQPLTRIYTSCLHCTHYINGASDCETNNHDSYQGLTGQRGRIDTHTPHLTRNNCQCQILYHRQSLSLDISLATAATYSVIRSPPGNKHAQQFVINVRLIPIIQSGCVYFLLQHSSHMHSVPLFSKLC